MTIDTKQLRELLAKATPGPWERDTTGYVADDEGSICVMSGDICVAVVMADNDKPHTKNADFMALSNNLLPSLLDELDALRKVAEVAEKCRDGSFDHGAGQSIGPEDFAELCNLLTEWREE